MKQLKILFITIIMFFLFLTPTLAATNPYGKYQDLYGVTTVRCTWYAWEQAYKYTGVALPGLGNAQNWYANAKKQGYSVGREAKARSIVVWASGDGYGHVGYVVSVDGDTMITNEGGIVTTVNEGIEDGIRRDVQSENLIGFIYLDEPKKPTTTTPSTPVETKSNNNTLSSINMDIQGFSFDKNILEYTLEVDYDIDIITIQATTEDKKAIVTGTGQKALSVGGNTYVLTVSAEDDSKKEYTIHITRKEKETNKNTISVIQNETVDNNQKKDKTIPIIIISVSSLLCITLSIVLIIKKRKTTQN